jgi:HlyD family secretion protein
MKRLAVGLVVLVLALAGLVALRLRAQSRAASAPPGGHGEIEGVSVDVSARIGARILEVHVREGAEVRKGAPLVDLDCADPGAGVAEAEARLLAARAQAEAASASIAASRLGKEAASAQSAAARAQADALAAQRDLARRQLERTERLDDAVAETSVDQSRSGAAQLAAATLAAEAQARASGRQAEAAGASLGAASAQARAAEASARAAEAALARARLLAAECRLVAPRDGFVEALPHEPGELVQAGQTLATLVDLAEVKAIFYLPNAEVGAARPGAEASVVADAFPGERFAGRILTVAAEAEFTPRNIQTRTDRDRLVYAVEVLVPNPQRRLRPGMPVQVTLAPAAADGGGARR